MLGGGAGNPGGNAGENATGNRSEMGESGTGGLLIIYANQIENSGKIESNGSKGGILANSAGGSSGGGSINIFYKKSFTSTGTITADGVETDSTYWGNYGGKGGNGTVSIGSISSGVYVSN